MTIASNEHKYLQQRVGLQTGKRIFGKLNGDSVIKKTYNDPKSIIIIIVINKNGILRKNLELKGTLKNIIPTFIE